MFSLRLLVRARADKRFELVQSLSSFTVDSEARPYRRLVLADLNDERLLCWIGDWDTREQLDRFMSCPTYRALHGAARVLGRIESEQVLGGEEMETKTT